MKYIVTSGEYIHGIYDDEKEAHKEYQELSDEMRRVSKLKFAAKTSKNILANDVPYSSSKSLSMFELKDKKVELDLKRGPNIVYAIIEIIDEDNEDTIGLYSIVPDKYENSEKYQIEEYVYNSY